MSPSDVLTALVEIPISHPAESISLARVVGLISQFLKVLRTISKFYSRQLNDNYEESNRVEIAVPRVAGSISQFYVLLGRYPRF